MVNLYEEIVGRGGVSPSHFFYDMTFGEAAAYMRGYHLRERDEWERTRQIAYMIAQVNSSKELSPTSIMPFPWDKEKTVEVDEKEIDRIRSIAQNIKL